MPRVHTEEINGFAHCPDPRCAGYRQEPVRVVRETVEHTFKDSGGDMPGVEKSMTYLQFAEEKDRSCPVCAHPREVSDQKRNILVPLSGHAQDGLLHFKAPDGSFKEAPAGDSEIEALRAQVAELTALVIEQRAETHAVG